MATEAERFKAAQQQTHRGPKGKSGRSKPGAPKAERTRAKAHAEGKATYALESDAKDRGGIA